MHEESLRAQEDGKGKDIVGPSLNIVEEQNKGKSFKINHDKKRKFNDSNKGTTKKVKMTCSICEKFGHFKRDCQLGKGNYGASIGGGGGDRMILPKIKDDAFAWRIDSDALSHVCKDCCWYKDYRPVDNGSVLYMGDSHYAPILGRGNVMLEFSSNGCIT